MSLEGLDDCGSLEVDERDVAAHPFGNTGGERGDLFVNVHERCRTTSALVLRIVSRSSPLSFMAMAPPARREWLLTRSAEEPQRCNFKALAAALTAVLAWEARA